MSKILIIPVLLLLMVAGSGLAAASESGWSELSIVLEEGQTENISLTVEIGAHISLVLRYAFEGMENVITVEPDVVGDGTTPILIHFERMGVTEKEGITPDNYRVKLVATQTDDKEYSLLVYLKLGELPPGVAENIQTRIDDLTGRVEAIESLTGRVEVLEDENAPDYSALIEALEQELDEGLTVLLTKMGELENVAPENWASEVENMLTELENLRATGEIEFERIDNELALHLLENSNPDNWEREILATKIMFSGKIADAKAEINLWITEGNKKSDEKALMYAGFAAVIAVVAMTGLIKFKKPRTKPKVTVLPKTPSSYPPDNPFAEDTLG